MPILGCGLTYEGPRLLGACPLQCAYDIFGDGIELVHKGFPTARQVFIGGSGRLPWIQNREGFREGLKRFYEGGGNSPERQRQKE